MKMRQRITDLLLRDFGYSFEKFNKKLEKRYGGKQYEELTDTQKHDYERQKKRNESFDEWFITRERETIMDCLHAINEHVYVANSIYPTTINMKKTRICKLSSRWRYLQIQYSLTDSGKVIHKINPKRITSMRRKMKKLAGKLSESDFKNWYTSWIKCQVRYMSKKQRENIDGLYQKLYLAKYKKIATEEWIHGA